MSHFSYGEPKNVHTRNKLIGIAIIVDTHTHTYVDFSLHSHLVLAYGIGFNLNENALLIYSIDNDRYRCCIMT